MQLTNLGDDVEKEWFQEKKNVKVTFEMKLK